MGGTKLCDKGMVQGLCPRYLAPTQVRNVSRSLATVSPERLIGRWDTRRIATAEIYPQTWDDTPENRKYVRENYKGICDLFAVACSWGDAIILWLRNEP